MLPLHATRVSAVGILAVVALAAAATPVQASHTIYITWSHSADCGRVPPLCSVSADHFVWSVPSMHCAGSAGSYSSCDVYHQCSSDGGGVLFEHSLYCSHINTVSCAGSAGGCGLGLDDEITIASGDCTYLTLAATVTAVEGLDSAQVSHSVYLCVNGFGPYVP